LCKNNKYCRSKFYGRDAGHRGRDEIELETDWSEGAGFAAGSGHIYFYKIY
jgi:hypothetical protein